MRDVRASLIARVKVGLHNPTENETASRYSGAMAKMYARIKFISMSRGTSSGCMYAVLSSHKRQRGMGGVR